MFVRFRVVRHRLIVNLVATRRSGGKIVNEHIARLGSAALPEPISAAERILFWRDLKERWRDLIARLGNRVTAEERKKALAAIHKRIPKPSEAEKQAVRIEATHKDIAFWEEDRDHWQDTAKRARETIANLEADIAKHLALADKQQQVIHSKQAQLLKLMRGERVEGDDETMLDYANGAASRRDAEIRAAPRPAARGKRGRQKRPHWLLQKEKAAPEGASTRLGAGETTR
jgi:hypothetical protein